MISLEALKPSQYKQVAEWEYGPQPEDADWERYEREMNEPQWQHLGMYQEGVFIGCVSLEKIDGQTMAYHVVTCRHAIHPYTLAQVLLKMAGELFKQGYSLLIAQIPKEKRAAVKLAIRCGMKESNSDNHTRTFTLTKFNYDTRRTDRGIAAKAS